MREFREFSDALQDWTIHGGAMNAVMPLPGDPGVLWQVGDWYEMKEATGTNPRETTEAALRLGGLTEELIAREMREWED